MEPPGPRVTDRGGGPGESTRTLWAGLGEGPGRVPGGASGAAQVVAPGGGAAPCCLREPRPWGAVPVAQAPDPRALNRHSPGSALPPGQAEAERAQDSEDAPVTRRP